MRAVYASLGVAHGNENEIYVPAIPLSTAPGSNPAASFDDLLNWRPTTQNKTDFAAWGCDMVVQGGKFPDGTNANLPDGTPVYPDGTAIVDILDQPLFICDSDGTKYLLGPTVIQSEHVVGADAFIPEDLVVYVVAVTLDETGTSNLKTLTTKLFHQESPLNQLAIVLDGRVMSAPVVNGPVSTGPLYISEGLTADQAQNVAAVIGSGALPLTFEVSSVDTVASQQQTIVTLIADQS